MSFFVYILLYFSVCHTNSLRFDIRRHQSSVSGTAGDQNAICSHEQNENWDILYIFSISIYNTTVTGDDHIMASVSKTEKHGKLHLDDNSIHVEGSYTTNNAALVINFGNHAILPKLMTCKLEYMNKDFINKSIEATKVFKNEDVTLSTTQKTPMDSVSHTELLTDLEASLDERLASLSRDIIEKVGAKVDSIRLHDGEDASSCFMPSDCQKSLKTLVTLVKDMRYNKNYVYDTETDGRDWIIVQRRRKGDVDFYRNWEDYKHGFGSRSGDFWFGNDELHRLTTGTTFELRIDMEYKNKQYYVTYDRFWIDNEEKYYTLHVNGFNGTAVDALMDKHSGQRFSTYDRDNDKTITNCAKRYKGGWWYRSCHSSNLNGIWESHRKGVGINWLPITGNADSLSTCEMKIRPVK